MSVIADSYHQNMAQRIEPDVQATLSDFLTYTEHFPAQVTRALTLIHSETLRAEKKIASIHANTASFSQLPTLPADQQKDPVQLRRDISYALEEAERAGRMRLEEATRLAEVATREQVRLDTLVGKLKAIPLPSRDPTPEDDGALTSPNLSRTARFGPEITSEKPVRRPLDKAATKLKARKIIVPGEVLPPPDPNAPPETFSDWSSPESTPPVEEPPPRKHITPRPRSRTPKLPKYDRSDREERDKKAARPRGPRMPGQPGTNAHSAVAGISTSNALLALNPPPADAVPGSRWLPWMKLTEWEMAKLRKRMKKNAIWVPSATMLRRELKNLGRGHTGREAARAAAEAEGTSLVDESSEADPTKIEFQAGEAAETTAVVPPVIVAEDDEDADAELINRGMRLNEAKKLKRARLLEEQREASAQIAREQANDSPESANIKAESASRKRKRESTPLKLPKHMPEESPDVLSQPGPPLRRIKLAHNPLQTQPVESESKMAAPVAVVKTTTRTTERRKTATPPPMPSGEKKKPTLVLKAGKAVSEEPPSRRTSLRRSSNVSLPNSSVADVAHTTKAATRRSKRPAPGVITGGDAESATVSASRRKAAPRKRTSGAVKAAAAAPEPVVEEELIDPDEPRYCVCGDVSWGTMIACENDVNCEKEWFHLSCVGLDELPPRRTKWYCPDCRKKLKLGQNTNGLVGSVRGSGAGR
ncbi:hypothetical protein AMS68_000993 [Peltaster fructicola]|uniref:PHD-type domain-containing protein n=1 Tax=Peltaster fructicola TaxID=286661 RepID=A0A6H0XL86_9PEZI|nr:hypothetical protein AMS68_000993 [Peltaster fructicola]